MDALKTKELNELLDGGNFELMFKENYEKLNNDPSRYVEYYYADISRGIMGWN
jgi:hypothetical protein